MGCVLEGRIYLKRENPRWSAGFHLRPRGRVVRRQAGNSGIRRFESGRGLFLTVAQELADRLTPRAFVTSSNSGGRR